MSKIQQFLERVIEKRNITPHSLGIKCGWVTTRIYERLGRTGKSTSLENIETMFAVLGIDLVSQRDGVRASFRNGRVVITETRGKKK